MVSESITMNQHHQIINLLCSPLDQIRSLGINSRQTEVKCQAVCAVHGRTSQEEHQEILDHLKCVLHVTFSHLKFVLKAKFSHLNNINHRMVHFPTLPVSKSIVCKYQCC